LQNIAAEAKDRQHKKLLNNFKAAKVSISDKSQARTSIAVE